MPKMMMKINQKDLKSSLKRKNKIKSLKKINHPKMKRSRTMKILNRIKKKRRKRKKSLRLTRGASFPNSFLNLKVVQNLKDG